jgi:RNA polymerase sigma-70 factor (ECF subfamily)
MGQMNEDLLLQQLRAADPAAWDALVELAGDRLFRAACLLCASEGDAENAVQETFYRFATTLPRFRGDSALYTWMHGILINVVRQHRRDQSRLVLVEVPPEGEAVPSEAGRALDAETAARSVRQALQRLTPDHRLVLVMRYYDQMPVNAIAAKLGCSEGTVKSRLFHARREMSAWVPESLNPFAP